MSETLMTLAEVSEMRWQLESWAVFDKVAHDLNDEDRALVASFEAISEGELRGLGMQYEMARLLREAAAEDRSLFGEAWAYMPIIVYEEYRHGVILAKLAGKEHEDLATCGFANEQLWTNPYELVVSLLVGEVVNVELYRMAARAAQHPELQRVLRNITSDEARHKVAWMTLVANICQTERGRKGIAAAVRTHGAVHQAEIGPRYRDGAKATAGLLGAASSFKIVKEKHAYFEKVLGEDMPSSLNEMLAAQVRSVRKTVKE